MKLFALIVISTLFFACSPSRNLQGTWKMIDYPELNRETQLQIEKKEFIFSIDGEVTKKIGYKYENNTIISDEIPIVKHRDSIEVIKVKKDTLILHLMERGQSFNRIFTRIGK